VDSGIIIVLATCNGGAYLEEQLDSLLAQSETQWTLIIRDDHSVDATSAIIREFSDKDKRIQWLQNRANVSGSALGNFSVLLSAAYDAGAEYVFCCDQDDVWEPEKLKVMMAGLQELEGESRAPSLLHHDLVVVNESLEPITDSFIKLMNLEPSDQDHPQRLISRNEVTGCALACNRNLLEIALPVSDQAVMHDWWLALCAAYFGRIAFMPERFVRYRQHGDNTIGAKSFWHGLNPFSNWIAGWRRGDQEFISTVKQARAFRDCMAERLEAHSEDYQSLDRYSGLVAASRYQRLRVLAQLNLWRSHWLLNVILVMRMLLLQRKHD
jgi:rhamnosyltransferase